MPRADFYLIDQPRFRANPLLLVCELARKAFNSDQKTAILARSLEQAQTLDELLWSFDVDAFIPHQLAGDVDDDLAPILIVAPGTDVEDRSLLINLREECAEGVFDRVLEIVAAEESERIGSRQRWRNYQQRGFELKKNDM